MVAPSASRALPDPGFEVWFGSILVRNLGCRLPLFDLFAALTVGGAQDGPLEDEARHPAWAIAQPCAENVHKPPPTDGARLDSGRIAPPRPEGGSVLLDSSTVNEFGRFSIAGLNPYLVLEETDGICRENGRAISEPFEMRLSQALADRHAPNSTTLPLIGGAIGFISYDFGRKFEGIASHHLRQSALPDARVAFYDNLLIEDLETGMMYVTAAGECAPAKDSLDALEREAREALARPTPPKSETRTRPEANFTRVDYEAAVARMIDYIEAGDIYIANMTQRLDVRSQADPFDVYRYLRTHNPAPFSAYLDYPEGQVASASMERFLQVRGPIVETRPIKGTRPRGATPVEDAAMRRELEQSEKDRSELLMIVDLERNDLNRVCCPNSVNVIDHFAIEEYATVFHLVSTIRGTLAAGTDVAALIRALFPGGSITGAPKIRAMEIIDELEHDRRGLYTGSIGYFGLDGDCDLNIVIRTAVYEEGVFHIGVGGGITCESETSFEYEETLQKAQAVLEAIGNAEKYAWKKRLEEEKRNDTHR